ncbi:Histidine kinase-, DNA gyrase B-, and HSP90-like ATPase [Aliiroseovarius sediminilitoris]|uniref:Histidine kinase-, DNA gyrase B-, and HSP90-like ATPase n=1 Tax=Aliiroseovarius sediminilitoris TaxID=1173584 RepID=A0A1I0NVI8_9RHOB|nr:ATP-binding protein [Aliiroseovarius sediminilitoris]SEW05470.1 Histidine kinase-, DNA gyrase B-, and HSP90-like ATPase [Aliiroseovarius sediminilitoris]
MSKQDEQVQIVDAYLALNALRQVGYRNTATAVAELVDNSIEAEAKKITIVTLSAREPVAKRTVYRVQKIAVLDDGQGMTPDELGRCLSLGWGTRLDTREGLGRFGFGLKGSSLSQAELVEVYSWQNGAVYKTYLDLPEVKEGRQQYLKSVEETSLPKEIVEAVGGKIGSSGTLVLWSKLDGVDFKRPSTLFSRMQEELCRIYRHFLDDNDDYGKKRDVSLVDFDLDNNKVEASHELKPNDPLYLLEPSSCPDSDGKATNVEFEKPYTIPVEYEQGKFSDIEIRLSIAKPETQKMGGNSNLGKHYARNTGISFVRAGREIDFGSFGFLDSDTRQRWWGVEVRFKPVLDELFGVTNNKQHIRGFKKLDPKHDAEQIEALNEAAEDPENSGHYKSSLHLELNRNLTVKINAMLDVIKTRKEGSSADPSKAKPDPVSEKVNKDVAEDHTETSSDKEAETKSEQEKLAERTKYVLETRPELSEEDAQAFAKATIDYKVDLNKGSWPGTMFLDLQFVANAAVGVINTRSPYYEKLWQHVEDSGDDRALSALEVYTMAYVRTEDEFRKTLDGETFEKFRDRWGYWVSKLLENIDE